MSRIITTRASTPPTTEATATRALHRRFYYGVGKKFLGWKLADEEQQDDGSWNKLGKDGWRHWTVPVEESDRIKWHPVHDHLKGCHRGIVSSGSTHVPFVPADFDRHTASVDPHDHIRRVIKGGRLLRMHFPQLCWIAEVNPTNGSMKYFGFRHGPIPITVAEKCATQIHEMLLQNRCGAIDRHGKQDIEVFPHNCVQVGLPMRTDKITVVASGILEKCIRRRKGPDGGMGNYETYSALAFLQHLQQRRSYDEPMLIRELEKACANLPYLATTEVPTPVMAVKKQQVEMITISTDAPLGPIVHTVKVRPKGEVPRSKGDYGSEPNSYIRQLYGLLELCRRMKRVATVEEGLNFIKANGLYSGEWSQSESRREHRITYLVNRISLTFDPTKCCGSNPRFGAEFPINIGKFDNWAKTFVGKVEGTRRSVDEYGNLVERRSVSVDWAWISVFLSIVEHCCVVCPNEDGSFPQDWAELIWTSLTDTGVVSVKWDDRKWKVARDWLEKKGIIKIVDRNWVFRHGDGQAMKWAVGKDFDRLHVWWKSVKEPSGNPAVSLEEFLGNMLHSPPLNSYPHTADSTEDDGSYQSEKSASRSPPAT